MITSDTFMGSYLILLHFFRKQMKQRDGPAI